MIPNLQVALCALVILGTQVVFSIASFKFNFTDVQQCDPVTISLSGKNDDDSSALRPASLSIVPFNSSPVVVPITNPAAVSGGVYLTFLPLIAGTQFLASLDDAKGENVVRVSDIIRVLPSNGQDANNTSCLPPQDVDARRQFTVEDNPSQCEEFSVRYNVSAVSQAPVIRLYNPNGPSFLLNHTLDDPVNGTAKYLMAFSRGREIVLLIDGGNGIRETTPLITVSGDSSSPSTCLGRGQPPHNASTTASTTPPANPIASKAVIIGSATGGGAVVLIALCMALFIARERRRRRQHTQLSFDPSLLQRVPDEEKPSFPLPTFLEKPPPEGSFSNPSYTKDYPVQDRKDSLASWSQVTPEDQRESGHQIEPLPSPKSESRDVARQSTDRLSLNSLDIEGMLNMATMQSESRSRQSSNPLLSANDLLMSAAPPLATLTIPKRTLKVNSDVPADPHSMTLSQYSIGSVNPFVEDGNSSDGYRSPISIRSSPTRLRSPFGAVSGLPASPRDVRVLTGRQSVARSSASSADWYRYGVAR